MEKIVFASNNANKLKEIQNLMGDGIQILSLKDIGCFEELPETSDTIEGNALQKARYVSEKYNVDCFADDTGLEVEALNGRPGVYSARYAGPDCSAEDNMNKLLRELKTQENRKARFKTVIASVIASNSETFEGIVEGEITTKKSGAEGFGYDPIFTPEENNLTFAEMSMEEKNKISHRGRALRKFVDFLNS